LRVKNKLQHYNESFEIHMKMDLFIEWIWASIVVKKNTVPVILKSFSSCRRVERLLP
jgi:hypothetical protein